MKKLLALIGGSIVFACAAMGAYDVVARSSGSAPQVLVPKQIPIPAKYFGMHIHHMLDTSGNVPQTPWPDVNIPTWRLWDVRTTWTDIEPARGVFQFGELDKLVDLAAAHRTEIQLTFGFTPGWASSRPSEVSIYRPGGAAEPINFDDWRAFLQQVANRYKGRIHIYEIWNEPNLKMYWSGSVSQMIQLSQIANEVFKGIDPSVILVSPSATGPGGISWLKDFVRLGGGRYVDVIGYHFYVNPDPPETMLPLIASVHSIMRDNGLGETPLWDTEAGWSRPKPFPSPDLAAGYLARAFILNWASGVSRFYWYAWDNHGWVSLETTEADDKTPTPAGLAFGTVQSWLGGAVMNSCSKDRDESWTCQITRDGQKAWIMWNPDQTQCVDLPIKSRSFVATQLEMKPTPVSGNCVAVTPEPLLLTMQ
jgi:hypothetical protein